MLTRWHYVALGAPLLLLALEWKRARIAMLTIIVAAIMLAAMQSIVDIRIRSIRERSEVPVSLMPRDHPLRRQFGALHGVSMLFLVGQVVAAGAIVALEKE